MNLFSSVLLKPEIYSTKYNGLVRLVQDLWDSKERVLPFAIVSIGIGFFKLLSPVYGDLPFLGDLFPALGNLAGGGIIWLEKGKSWANLDTPIKRFIKFVLLDHKDIWSYGCIIAAIIHFFLPGMLFF
ncbi:MAG: hypothetical protein SNJ78_00580 [Spirochaetales bacterium]